MLDFMLDRIVRTEKIFISQKQKLTSQNARILNMYTTVINDAVLYNILLLFTNIELLHFSCVTSEAYYLISNLYANLKVLISCSTLKFWINFKMLNYALGVDCVL